MGSNPPLRCAHGVRQTWGPPAKRSYPPQLSPAQSGNELKPAIALGSGNRTRCPLHTRARGNAGIALTASGSGPRYHRRPRFSPRLQRLTTERGNLPVALTRSNTSRSGAPWSILTATARTKLNNRGVFLQRHSAANPRIPAEGRLRQVFYSARQLTLSLTRTSRIRRPACTGSTCRHARHLAGTMTLSWMTTSATTTSTRIPRTNLTGRNRLPRMPRNLNPRLQETRLTPRDFDPDRTESVASNEDEPDFSFAAVVDMIRNYYMERPTTTAPTRTTTVFDQTRGVQSDRGPAFNLPTSHLLGWLIDNANTAMARLTREQSNGFLPFPMKRHWRFYRTDSTSLSAPYVVPPSLASLTREKPGDSKHRLFPLSQSVLAGLESAMASVAETASWLDW